MSLQPGEEFKMVATPSQELLRKLAYLAAVGSESVLTVAGLHGGGAASERKEAKADGVADIVQFLDQQRARQRQIDELMNRLDELDRVAAQAVREAQDRLDEIRSSANRTKDGRIVFEGEDGKIYDEDGNEVDAGEIDWETWNPAAWKHGEYLDAVRAEVHAFTFQEKVDGLKDRLTGDVNDADIVDIEAEIDALGAEAAAFEVSFELETNPEFDGEPARTTSAAKLYAGDHPEGSGIGPQFSYAVAPPEPSHPAAPAQKPVLPLTPD